MKIIMNKKFVSTAFLVLVLSSCGSSDAPSQETTFYKKETVNQKKLELSVLKQNKDSPPDRKKITEYNFVLPYIFDTPKE